MGKREFQSIPFESSLNSYCLSRFCGFDFLGKDQTKGILVFNQYQLRGEIPDVRSENSNSTNEFKATSNSAYCYLFEKKCILHLGLTSSGEKPVESQKNTSSFYLFDQPFIFRPLDDRSESFPVLNLERVIDVNCAN